MAETSMKSTTTDVEAELNHQHSIQISPPSSPPPPPPRQQPPPPPPLPLKSRNHRNLWGIIGERKSNNQQKEKSSHHSIKMAKTKTPPQAPPLPPKSGPKKPSIFYLSEEQRDNYINLCVPLYNAALKGDWHAAEEIIAGCPEGCPELINTGITKRQDTVLHIISATKHTHFAEKLVNLMRVEDLELQNGLGETALCLAVASNVKMVHILLKRNSGLLRIRKNGDLPFMLAVRFGDKHMVEYIYSKTDIQTEKWNYLDQKRILESCLSLGLFDIALKIFTHCKDDHKIETDILGYLANSPSAFDGTSLFHTILPGSIDNSKVAEIVRLIWRKIVKQKYDDIWKLVSGQSSNEKDEGFLFAAARLGNYKFIRELLKLYPDITWGRDGNKHTIFHIAVIHRHENVYNLLYDLGSKKFAMKDNEGNHILHLAAIKPAQSRLNIVSGAALQMQRELLWFKEVQTRVSPADRRQVNNEGKTPQELFTEQHADLMEKGEAWMKETASQCMIVAALIATIMFAAAFTLPGGTDGNNGHPIFVKRSAFIVFAVTDAISLCTSSASILVFLAILTARYTENDFLVSLPMKLMVGLVTLFISITTMMIAYGASFFLLYPESMKWIPVLVTVLAGLPVILFAGLQFRLLIDVINSTFNSRHLFRPKKHMLY